MKIVKTEKHDSLSLKVMVGKLWVSLYINRRGCGVKIPAASNQVPAMRELAERMAQLFEKSYRGGAQVGAAFAHVEASLKAESATV